MLTHLFIRDFAIIDELDLDLENGMTTLTGETGAGKSILLDAISLILGDRADSTSVKHGAAKSDISATFDIKQLADAIHWLSENDLENDDDCVIRRVINADGRSKAYINGYSATLLQIRTLGEMLIDIHGQHEHQSLMRRDIQRQMLDDYANHKDLLAQVGDAYDTWYGSENLLKELQEKTSDRNERLALLKYQVDDLEQLDPQENEYEALVNEHNQLANVDQHISSCATLADVIYDNENSLYNVLSQQINSVAALNSEDKNLTSVVDLLTEAQAQLSEASSTAKNYLDKLENDPERLDMIDQRLTAIHDQARKHHVEPDQLHSVFISLSQELTQLTDDDQSLEQLLKDRDQNKKAYLKLAKSLSTKRAKAAKELSEKITGAMQNLNMQGGTFSITVEQSEPLKCSAEGFDAIDYLVSANPGQPPKLLSKVASGGELARISLAIQMITAHQGRIPTLIFDEVDSGVGGATAEIVGQHLREIGNECQVLCVTHLPQVAAQAHHHLQVNKSTTDTSTQTSVAILKDEQRQHEIARMLGGVDITQQTLDHAQEMIERAQSV